MSLDLSGLDQFKASALLSAPAPAAEAAPPEMELDLIDFDPEQPRRSLDETLLGELAASIRAKGVLEPVSLRTHPDRPGRYIVNRGERRVRASRMAGLATVPWFLDERIDRYAQAIENLQREDLSPFDLAHFIAARESEGTSRAEIARRLGKPASFVTEAAGLVDAPAPVREAFDDGRARDTRVLYQLSRGLRDKPEAVKPVLETPGRLTRQAVNAALHAPAAAPASEELPTRRIEGTRVARAILVEHGGRRGRLRCNGQPGKRTAQIDFEDGSRKTVELADLKLIAWTGG